MAWILIPQSTLVPSRIFRTMKMSWSMILAVQGWSQSLTSYRGFLMDGTECQEFGTGSHDDIALSFEWPNLEIKGNDKFLEQILLDIESAQVRVLALKSRLGKMFSENSSDFYTPGMFIPGDPNYRPSLSP